jgi:hypothetical protein
VTTLWDADTRFRQWRRWHGRTLTPKELPELLRQVSLVGNQCGVRTLGIRELGTRRRSDRPGTQVYTLEAEAEGRFEALFHWLDALDAMQYAAVSDGLEMAQRDTAEAPLRARVRLNIYLVDPGELSVPGASPDEVSAFLRDSL